MDEFARLCVCAGLGFFSLQPLAIGVESTLSLSDTGSREKSALVEKAGAAIRGDAVVENSRLHLIVRKSDGRLALSYKLGDATHTAAEWTAVGARDDAVVRLDSIKVAKNSDGEVLLAVQAVTKGKKKLSFDCTVRENSPIVEITPSANVSRLALSTHASHAVVPDIFGDDLVFRASETKDAPLYLPANYAFLEMLGAGDAILMGSWSSGDKEAQVVAGEEKGARSFTRAEVPCAAQEKIWISVLADPGIWREEEAANFSAFDHKKLDWTPPFPARYRCDLHKKDSWGLTDSWRRETNKQRVWCSFLNYCYPPLSFTNDGAFLRVPKYQASGSFARGEAKAISYTGPILLYPFDRERKGKKTEKTPADKFTVLDIVHQTLGSDWLKQLDVGEGVLEDEPYPTGFVYVATCGCTGDVEKIFKSGDEKKKAAAIRREFGEMDQFVRYNRKRIEEYAAFAPAYSSYVDSQAKSHAGNAALSEAITELAPLVEYIPQQYKEQLADMKTPDDCAKLSDQVMALIDSDDEKKLKRVQDLGKSIRVIGGTQDDLLAAYRLHVKILRQKAGLIHSRSTDPATREAMRGILAMTQKMLRVRSPYEGH